MYTTTTSYCRISPRLIIRIDNLNTCSAADNGLHLHYDGCEPFQVEMGKESAVEAVSMIWKIMQDIAKRDT